MRYTHRTHPFISLPILAPLASPRPHTSLNSTADHPTHVPSCLRQSLPLRLRHSALQTLCKTSPPRPLHAYLTHSRASIAHFSHVAECSIDTLLSPPLTTSPQFQLQTAMETHLPTPSEASALSPSILSQGQVTEIGRRDGSLYLCSAFVIGLEM